MYRTLLDSKEGTWKERLIRVELEELIKDLCKTAGLPENTELEELLNHFGIEDVSEVEVIDCRIKCCTPQGEVKIIFLPSLTFSERREIWIERETVVKKYLVEPETAEYPWHTIYLGSNVYAGNKSLTFHIDETDEKSVGKWVIRQKENDIAAVRIESSRFHLYESAEEICECLRSYLQAEARIEAIEIYYWLIHSMSEYIAHTSSIDIFVWKEKQAEKKSVVFQCFGGKLEHLKLNSGTEVLEFDIDGTWSWRNGKESVVRLGTGYTSNKYKIEMEDENKIQKMEFKTNQVQDVGEKVTALIEQAERAVNKYIPLFLIKRKCIRK